MSLNSQKYIVIIGGSFPDVGKGILASSLGLLLKRQKPIMIKFDGYLNESVGTMYPYHAKPSKILPNEELFVTDDGFEGDTDLGNYERFLNENLLKANNITGGGLIREIFQEESLGKIAPGQVIQILPHLSQKFIARLRAFEGKLFIIEIGGTVGDLEQIYALDALRRLKNMGSEVLFVLLDEIPIVYGDYKLKLMRRSYERLITLGIQPDLLVCRSTKESKIDFREALSNFCNVRKEDIFRDFDLDSIYELPFVLQKQRMDVRICEKLSMKYKKSNLAKWRTFVCKKKG
jgi:CTP synthase